MTIKNVYYTNHSCKYYSRNEWEIETNCKDYDNVLDYCRQYMYKKVRSYEEYLQAKDRVQKTLDGEKFPSVPNIESMMTIDGDGYYDLTLENDGKPDGNGCYHWRYITHAENIY